MKTSWAGKYKFNIPGNPSASIVNLGSITATFFSGRLSPALVAPGVPQRRPPITATLGTVGLRGPATPFTLDFLTGDRLITLAVTDQIASPGGRCEGPASRWKSLVSNEGNIHASGAGPPSSSPPPRRARWSTRSSTIPGVIEADTVGTRNGMIVLGRRDRDQQAHRRSGADGEYRRQDSRRAGKAKGTTGGTVVVTGGEHRAHGRQHRLRPARPGGGKVLIGGRQPAAARLNPGRGRRSNWRSLETFVIPTAHKR